jgi:AcrR family transcriptional regulator
MTTLGRKRSFDKTVALEKAMRVFWDNGFAGTSISDLTDALGINKPSLYAAFGNKEQLFNAALDHYTQHYAAPVIQCLREPAELPLSQRLENYLCAGITNNTAIEQPKGCFAVKSYCESGSQSISDETNSFLKAIGSNTEKKLEEVFLNEQHKGQLTKSLSAKEAAAYLLAITYGLSVMARRGKPSETLHAIAKTAIKTLTS